MHNSSLNNNSVFSTPPIVAGMVQVLGTVIAGILIVFLLVKVKNLRGKVSAVSSMPTHYLLGHAGIQK